MKDMPVWMQIIFVLQIGLTIFFGVPMIEFTWKYTMEFWKL